jgi:hypothetical protein
MKALARIFHAPEVFNGKAYKRAAVRLRRTATPCHSTALKNGPANLANKHLRERFLGEIFSTYFSKIV